MNHHQNQHHLPPGVPASAHYAQIALHELYSERPSQGLIHLAAGGMINAALHSEVEEHSHHHRSSLALGYMMQGQLRRDMGIKDVPSLEQSAAQIAVLSPELARAFLEFFGKPQSSEDQNAWIGHLLYHHTVPLH